MIWSSLWMILDILDRFNILLLDTWACSSSESKEDHEHEEMRVRRRGSTRENHNTWEHYCNELVEHKREGKGGMSSSMRMGEERKVMCGRALLYCISCTRARTLKISTRRGGAKDGFPVPIPIPTSHFITHFHKIFIWLTTIDKF